ncbi:MAG: hypothetical protein ACQXXL_01005 [Candidatus Methanosuratincola sp.]|nr:hypothetical protein [Candidatus Methanosuratincola sp.]
MAAIPRLLRGRSAPKPIILEGVNHDVRFAPNIVQFGRKPRLARRSDWTEP